ncbi:protein of unknown function [Micropruina glycogenica]|uniref:Uncharacterized protein n=1 Tax=Micropruina glycogenica TaxID=75385 RepID=A0A2N9JCD2_9ACTN|nr:protein of unknown function [Micropruina glycogenica]
MTRDCLQAGSYVSQRQLRESGPHRRPSAAQDRRTQLTAD